MFEKLKLLKQCFPDSWLRKSIFLFLPTDTFRFFGELRGFLTKKGNEVILLCVDEKHRREGIGSELLLRTSCNYAYTFSKNFNAVNFYLRNNYRIDSYIKSPFGTKVKLVKLL